MSRFSSLPSFLRFLASHGRVAIHCLAAFLTLLPSAIGQDFTLTMAPFNPFAVDPGRQTSSFISLSAGTGFTGTVNLTCQVSSQATGQTPPTCNVSPASLQPTGSATATILTQTSTGTASPGSYTVTVTGTGPSTSHSGSQPVTVLSVNPAFTITVAKAVAPSSVTAGSGAQGIININPIFGYSGTVTLSCASITPLVTIPPVCSFNPNPVPVLNGTVASSQISITTFGPVPAAVVAHTQSFDALWLPIPMLTLVGLGMARGRTRSLKAWGVLALFVLAGSLLLIPGCATNTTPSTTAPNGTTPKNTYTFTLQGVDDKGNISSNTGTSNVAPTVTLTVD